MAMVFSESTYNPTFSQINSHSILRILVYSSVFYFFSFFTADTDLWGHIKFGNDLWASKTLHRFDIYSYTAYGREWINHEWLSELLMYFIYTIAGSPGLLLGKLLIGFAIVYVLSRISFNRAYNPLIYGLIFVLLTFVLSPGFMIRPQLVTFLFTSLFLYVFHLYLERRKNLLWSLPLIMILWVNCHGGFLVGIGMFFIVLVCEIISHSLKTKREAQYPHNLIFWFILTSVVVLINPYGYCLLVFLYETLSIPRNISEWCPIGIFDLSYLRLKVLVLLLLLTIPFGKNKKRYWEIAIIVVALIYAFKHQRHTPIFAIVAGPYLTENLSMMFKDRNLPDKLKLSPSSYLIINIFLVFLIGYQLFYTVNKYIKAEFNIIVNPRKYPIYAVNFLKENKMRGNIFLPFEWGEYVIWKLYPDCKISIDGRFRTVYPQGVIDDHFKVGNDKSRWEKLLNKYPTDIILTRQSLFFHRLISTQREWIYVYSDPLSIIFVKNEDSQKDILERLKRKELRYPHTALTVYFP